MRIFIGQYDRTIDAKNRIQIPAQLRAVIDPKLDGAGFYVTLGESPRTLAIYPERVFEQLVDRMETEFIPTADSRRFELQFYAMASHVDVDGQGRIVLPDKLRKKARFGEDVVLVGQKRRVEIWDRQDLLRTLDIDFESDEWPDWQGFLRMRPLNPDAAPRRDPEGGQRSRF